MWLRDGDNAADMRRFKIKLAQRDNHRTVIISIILIFYFSVFKLQRSASGLCSLVVLHGVGGLLFSAEYENEREPGTCSPAQAG